MKPWSQDWFIAAGAYPGFCSRKQLEVFLLPLDRMLVHRRSLPPNLSGFPNNLLVPIYTSGWREALWELSVLPKNITQCPRPGLEPEPLTPESSALTRRPPCFPIKLDTTYRSTYYILIQAKLLHSHLFFLSLWPCPSFSVQQNLLVFDYVQFQKNCSDLWLCSFCWSFHLLLFL